MEIIPEIKSEIKPKFKMSLLKAVNVFFFQWFFIRLTKCSEQIVENYTLLSFALMTDGNISSRGTGEIKTYQWYSFQFWVLPCTGWYNDFIFLNNTPKFIKCSKKLLKDE